jgi:hypothetical protein
LAAAGFNELANTIMKEELLCFDMVDTAVLAVAVAEDSAMVAELGLEATGSL